MRRSVKVALGAYLLAACGAAVAGDTADWQVAAGAGYRYDSNVNVVHADTASGEGDSALLLKFGVDGTIPFSDALSFNAGYDYRGTSYRELSEFDLALHHVSAKLRYKHPAATGALSFDKFTARLDDQRFVEMRQVSPSLARLLGNRFYLRGAYSRADKAYATLARRNAINDAFRADLYVLIDGMQQYLRFGYRRDREDAADDSFDYDGAALQLGYGHALRIAERSVDLEANLRLERRSYKGVWEAIDQPRRDARLRAAVRAALPLTRRFTLEGEIEHRDHASNVTAAELTEQVYTIGVAAAF